MADAIGTFITRWGVAVDAFNRDDFGPIEEMFAPDCVFESSSGIVGSNRQEILQALRSGRAAGWLSHNPLHVATGGGFMVSIFRNDYADGSSLVAAGVVRLNDEGRIVEVRTMEPAQVAAVADRTR